MAHSCNTIVAIDVAERIHGFARRIGPLAKHVVALPQGVTAEELAFHASADAVLVSIHQELTTEHLASLPKLCYVGVLGSSLKKIDTGYAKEHGIVVTNVQDYCDHETAEWVALKMLEHFRECDEPRSAYGKTLGIVGLGAVGRLVARYAHSLGLRVLFFTPSKHVEMEKQGLAWASLEEIFASSDVISFHTPAHTAWLDGHLLSRLRKGACLINTVFGRMSLGTDLEYFLQHRPDITVIMDAVAQASYPELRLKAHKQAYITKDSIARLDNKFFQNIESYLEGLIFKN